MVYTVTVAFGNGPGSLYQAVLDANSDDVGGRIVAAPGIDTIRLTITLPYITVDSLEIFPTSTYFFIDGYFSQIDPVFHFVDSASHSCLSDSVIIYNVLATKLWVTNINDSGSGSLREAISFANQSKSRDSILFNIPGMPPHTINASDSYSIRREVIIDGSRQPANGYAGTAPKIAINGGDSIIKCFDAKIPFYATGIERFEVFGMHLHHFNEAILATGWYWVTIGSSGKSNVITNNFDYGIRINNGEYVNVGYNKIGVDASGTIAEGNGAGIIVEAVQKQTSIHNNTISGNDIGIYALNTTDILIYSNKIGTDINAEFAIPNNSYGLFANNSSEMFIGSSSNFSRNYFGGNQSAGILITGNSDNDTILNNYIGISSTMQPISNNTGIQIESSAAGVLIKDNTISKNVNGIRIDTAASHVLVENNSIYENDSIGIICRGFQNTFTRNTIYDNGYKGIETNTFGNDSILAPSIDYAGFSGIVGTARPLSEIELYYSSSMNQSAQGKTYITTLQTDSSGEWRYPPPLYNSFDITATQTDIAGNTSEFADIVPSVNLGPDTTICYWDIWDAYELVAGSGLSSYIWNTGDTSFSIAVDTTGYYVIWGITPAGDTLIDSVYLEVIFCIGIEEVPGSQVSIFPVPANENIRIIIPEYLSNNGVLIEIFNQNGKLIKHERTNSSQTDIRLTEPKGLYFVRLFDYRKEVFFSKRFVLQ